MAVGILEVQLNLDRIFSSLSFIGDGAELFLKYGESLIPVLETREYVPMEFDALDTDRVDIFTERTEYDDFDLLIHRHPDNTLNALVFNIVLLGAGLLIPTFILWLFVYRFASKLISFSHHIRRTKEEGLISYNESTGVDEFDIVVSEYNSMTQTINELILSVREAEKLKNDASYYAMSSQINPHFMFNTLENIRMRIELEEYTVAGDMLFELSNFLRYSISLRRESTLFDEINHIRQYMTIYQYRQSSQIAFSIEIDEDVENIRCPFFILQPIVENCIMHGMTDITSGVEISINVTDTKNGVQVCVSDNGCGMTDSEIEELNIKLNESPVKDENLSENISYGGVGIINVNSRLKYFYGNDYGISFSHNPTGGLLCIISMGYDQMNGIIPSNLYSSTA